MSISHFDSVAEQEHYLGMVREDLDLTIKFWTDNSHGEDIANNGFINCLDKSGKSTSSDRFGWQQAQQIWTYTQLHRKLQRFRNEDVYKAAVQGGDFLLKIRGENGGALPVTVGVKTADKSVVGECYFAMAMAGLAAITEEANYKKEALSAFEKVKSGTAGSSPPLAELCVVLNAAQVMGDCGIANNDIEEVRSRALDCMKKSSADPSIECDPGAAFQAALLMLREAKKSHDKELKDLAVDAFVTRPFENCWDADRGGLVSGEDGERLSSVHADAIAALLVAFGDTNHPKYWELFTKALHYTYMKFVDEDLGEWIESVNPDGTPLSTAKGSPRKGCYGIPRALILCEFKLDKYVRRETDDYF